ncbi:LysM peptidoglycan-binding domain-containing protein [Aneurinibacillus sp. Ricciae_BoGa-3]|uniref:LysM peptidoglycan-binding domain-containing protein n=1 Tax=Aneurinibacillus sp. Ricciae_BoGa-3 TaxID=3022697 RepID=UPI002340741F|nr:LysM peptidoglycan-binding domain-containing protein [Aneurinibacillus sp. Ricciae_BoGa-3]WCK56041.1 LysM peptidoglycan-binding domain-containing protein [Aneurinibacillus sp. Ricciae_BoGa-3]
MDKDRMEHSDQAEELRSKMEQMRAPVYSVPSVDSLPPRKQAHPKPPPPRAALFLGGAVLLLVLSGGGFWAYKASKPVAPAFSSGSTSQQPADKTGSSANNGKQGETIGAKQNGGSSPVNQTSSVRPGSPAQSGQQQGAKTGLDRNTTGLSAKTAPATNAAGSSAKAVHAAAPSVPPAASKTCTEQKPATVSQASSPKAQPRNRVLYHRVRPGETLYRLSLRYYNTGQYQYYLANYNGIKDAENVITGTYLKIPIPPR